MKHLLLLIAILSSVYGIAQHDTLTLLHSYTSNEGMRLKWLPKSDEAFLKGYEKGYNLYRSEVVATSGGGEKLGPYVKLNKAPIKMWSVEKLKKELATDSSLSVASLFVEGLQEVLDRPAASTVADAVEIKKGNEMLHMMGLFVALADNSIAESLGLYFVDSTVTLDKKYMYKIEIPDNEKFTSYLFVYSVKEQVQPKVMGVTTKLYPQAVYLTWFNNHNRNYPYFNIYRSTKKNGGYIKINTIPYAGQRGNAEFDATTTSIIDSIPEFDKTYYYKIVGVNGFEEEGTLSDPAGITANYLLEFGPQRIRSTEEGGSDLKLTWEVKTQEEKHIDGFSIFRAPMGTGPYLPLNEKRISSNTLSYVDDSPKGSSNYYIITAYNSSGDSVNSVMHAHLLVDSIAPAKPIELRGVCDTNGVVTLTWKLNEEQDLKGYRIFKTYDLHLDPDRVIPGDTLVSDFADTINLKMPYNYIYYRVYALDQHFNTSFPSEFVKIPLPDKNAPTNGFLVDYSVGMSGITVKWTKSTAYDLNKMYLMRKADTDFEYKTILELSGDSLNINSFTDTSTKSFVNYQYAVLSEDYAGLKSDLSRIFLIQQLDKRKVPTVFNLRAIVSKENKMIKLSWDFTDNAVTFRVFRSRNGGSLETYKYIDGKDREYYDKSLKPRSKYVYLFVAELKGGYKSGYSKKLEVKY